MIATLGQAVAMAIGITTLSILLQFTAATVAFRLFVATRRLMLLPLALAVLLMSVRRSYSLYNKLAFERPIDPGAETIALTISALMLLGLIGLSRLIVTNLTRDDQPPAQRDAKEARGIVVSRLAIMLGAIAIISSCAVGYFAFRASREAIHETIFQGHLNIAQVVAQHANTLPSATSEVIVVEKIRQLWKNLDHPSRNSYVCVVRSDGQLLLHTLRPESEGSDVGDLPIETSRDGGPKTLRTLVAAHEAWDGNYTSSEGELQVAACAYVPRLDSMVMVDTPAEEIDAAVRASVLPWAAGLSFTTFLLLPLSLGLLCWSSAVSQANCKRVERTLRKNATNLARAEKLALIGHWHWDITANKMTWSDQYYRIVGLDRGHFAANYDALLSCIHPDDLEFFKNTMARVLKERASYNIEYRIVRPNHDIRVIREQGEVGVDTNGNGVEMFGTAQDITEGKQAEDGLRKSERELRLAKERLDTALTASRTGVYDWNVATGEIIFDDNWTKLLGYKPGELEPHVSSWERLVHPEDLPRLKETLRAHLDGDTTHYDLENRLRKKDGQYLWTHDRGRVVEHDEDGKPLRMVGVDMDITDRKRAEEALLESQALYKSLVDHIPQMIFRKDLDGRYTFAGPHFCESLHVPVEGIVGKTDFDFYPTTLAEKYRRDDARVMSSGETLEVIEEHEAPGGTMQYMHVIKTPIYDHQQRIVGVQGIFWDVTKQKQTEETIRQRESELAHAGRLSLMGEMVAGFAHEVNQPLYSIGNFAKACENHIKQDATVDTEKLSQWLAEISACARRSKEILARLKGFARQSVPQQKSLRIDQAIDESIKMLEFELRDRNVAVDYELAEGIEVRADDVQVQQVFANLIRNACEAFHESGTEDPRLTIRTTQRHGFCEVSVEDNGPGMDGEQIERAFQSFSTTKSAGLGLGLAISRTIVEGHGGKIAIVPNRHRGITCRFTLPLARGDE